MNLILHLALFYLINVFQFLHKLSKTGIGKKIGCRQPECLSNLLLVYYLGHHSARARARAYPSSRRLVRIASRTTQRIDDAHLFVHSMQWLRSSLVILSRAARQDTALAMSTGRSAQSGGGEGTPAGGPPLLRPSPPRGK